MGIEFLIGLVIAGLVLAPIAFIVGQRRVAARVQVDSSAVAAEAERVVQEAEARKRELLLEARDEALKIRSDAEQDVKQRRGELAQSERRLQQKEESLDRRVEQQERREAKLTQREQEIDALREEATELRRQTQLALEKTAGLTGAEAKALLLQEIEDEVRQDASRRVREIEAEAKEEAERRSKKVIALAIQRWAGEQVAEHVMSVVHLPNDEMKGRIIGREGRNIRALEAATGVDLIIDDTPEAITLSGFD